ncbi:hypothetical protein [Fusibacter sp. A1]
MWGTDQFLYEKYQELLYKAVLQQKYGDRSFLQHDRQKRELQSLLREF